MAELIALKESAANTNYPKSYNPGLLESFTNRNSHVDQLVTIHAPEFTCLCEVTGQPDFGKITITYAPDQKLVESKSLKLYMFSFREQKSFHEHAVCTIGKDLRDLLDPWYLEVLGQFLPRGGISIHPFFQHAHPEWRAMKEARKIRHMQEVLR